MYLSSNAISRISNPNEEHLAAIRKMIKEEVFARGMFAALQSHSMIPILDDFNQNFGDSYMMRRLNDDRECLRLRLGAFLINLKDSPPKTEDGDDDDEEEGTGYEGIANATGAGGEGSGEEAGRGLNKNDDPQSSGIRRVRLLLYYNPFLNITYICSI